MNRIIRDTISEIKRIPFKCLNKVPSNNQIAFGGFADGLCHGADEAASRFSETACAYEPETHIAVSREWLREVMESGRSTQEMLDGHCTTISCKESQCWFADDIEEMLKNEVPA